MNGQEDTPPRAAGGKTIEWRTVSTESHVEQSSPDGRWHLDTKTAADGSRTLRLSNYDPLCSPMGSGATPAECWRGFIADCARYEGLLKAARIEASVVLAGLELKGG